MYVHSFSYLVNKFKIRWFYLSPIGKKYKKIASSRGAPQENDAKFKFAIHPQLHKESGNSMTTVEMLYCPICVC